MESRFLNVSIMQHTITADLDTNLRVIEESVENLMMGYVRPELIVGVEFGISKLPITMEDGAIQFLSSLAKKHRVYLVPGTFAEKAEGLKDGEAYNTCPVFGPDGTLLCRYRKKVPFRPGEMSAPSNETEDYCIFEIQEKGITVGLQICYDQFFPEISRTLALKGAELMLWTRSNTAMCLRLYREPGRWRMNCSIFGHAVPASLGHQPAAEIPLSQIRKDRLSCNARRPRHWSQRRWIFPV